MFILLSFYFTIRFIFGNSKPKSTSEQKIGIGKLTLQHLVHSSMFLRVFLVPDVSLSVKVKKHVITVGPSRDSRIIFFKSVL